MIVVYDVTSGDSFVNVKRWLSEIEQNCDVVNRVLGACGKDFGALSLKEASCDIHDSFVAWRARGASERPARCCACLRLLSS